MRKLVVFGFVVAAIVGFAVGPANAEDAFVRFSGTQKVCTGYCPNGKTRIETDFALEDLTTKQQRIWDSNDLGVLVAHFYVNGSLNWGFCYNSVGDGYWSSTARKVTDERITAVVDANLAQVRLIGNGGSVTNNHDNLFDAMPDYNHQSSQPLMIAGNGGGAGQNPCAKMRLYAMRIYDAGQLTHEFLPRIRDGIVGLYDVHGDGGFIYDSRLPQKDEYLLGYGGDIETSDDGYIESLGTSAINTRFIPTDDSRFEIDFRYLDIADPTPDDPKTHYQQRIFGADGDLYMASYLNGSCKIGIGYANAVYDKIDLAADTDRHLLVIDYKNRQASYKTGALVNKTMTMTSELPKTVGNRPVALFNNVNNAAGTKFWEDRYRSKARIYGVRIYRANELVHDYIPCVKGGVPGFRDKVDGAFVTGEDVSGFVAGGNVERLADDAFVELTDNRGEEKADNTAYNKFISLDYQLNENSRVELDSSFAENFNNQGVSTRAYAYFTGYYKDRSDNDHVERFYVASFGQNIRYRLGTSSFKDITTDIGASKDKDIRRTVVLDSGRKEAAVITAGFTNYVVSTGSDALSRSFGTTLRLGANFDPSWFAPLKIYGCKVYENGVLMRDYRPCVTNANPGLRDVLSGNFFANSWGVTQTNKLLTASGQIPCDEASKGAYIEFNGTQAIDIGYKPNGTTRFEVDVQFTETAPAQQRIYSTADNSELISHLYGNGSCRLAFCHNKSKVWTSTDMDVSLERMTVVVDAAQKQMRILKDGGTVTVNCDKKFADNMTDKDHQCTQAIWIGGYDSVNGNPHARMRLYGFRIYENGEKKREFIPCKSGDKVGLYETVDGEFYENDLEGGDDFKIGGASATLAVEPADTAVDVQKSATLKAIAAGAVEYRWYKDGNLIEGETGETLTVNWRKGKPYEETYEVRPVYVLFGEQVLGDSSAAVVTYGRLGLFLVVE